MQTRVSLLARIRNLNDGLAWSEFVRLYAPLVHSYGMKNGLQDADAADLAQETLRLVMRAAPEFVYDPAKGTFRGWLFTIARNEIRKFASRQKRTLVGSGDSKVREMLETQPSPDAEEAEWNREYQMNLFRCAAETVQGEFRETTWQAFWRTIIQHQDIQAVAQDLGLSLGAVYIARSRITARIRQEISAIREV